MTNPPDNRLLRFIFFCGRPLALIYGPIMRLRAHLYKTGLFKRHRLPARVISVGNLTMGGTGKTPMVIHLARYLKEGGRRPVVISRGYGGKARNPVNVVSDGSQILLAAEICGDEPRLLAESLPGIPVLTGPRRAVTGQYAISRFQADTIIMDDGFQHLAVDRDLDLVLFNRRAIAPADLFKASRVLPGGPLREPASALSRAHAFIITDQGENDIPASKDLAGLLSRKYPATPIFTSCHEPAGLFDGATGRKLAPAETSLLPVYGFCGIGSPEGFRAALLREGLRLVDFKAYPDHQAYKDEDLDLLCRAARAAGARALITTEKDLVKLRPFLPTELPLLFLKITLKPDKGLAMFLAAHLKKGLAGG